MFTPAQLMESIDAYGKGGGANGGRRYWQQPTQAAHEAPSASTCSQLRMVLTVAQSKAAMPSMQVRAPQAADAQPTQYIAC